MSCKPVILLTFVFLSLAAAAQMPAVRHNCWDIDVTVPSGSIPPVYIVAKADTALMLISMAKEYLGVPYHYGGRSPKGFDCAGFVLYLYRHFGYDLPGWCGALARHGIEVSDTRNLQRGDLVFFGGRHQSKVIGHTGIVVEANEKTGVFRFIHSSTTAGVIISRSTEEYYKSRYITARRILK